MLCSIGDNLNQLIVCLFTPYYLHRNGNFISNSAKTLSLETTLPAATSASDRLILSCISSMVYGKRFSLSETTC